MESQVMQAEVKAVRTNTPIEASISSQQYAVKELWEVIHMLDSRLTLIMVPDSDTESSSAMEDPSRGSSTVTIALNNVTTELGMMRRKLSDITERLEV